MKKLVVLLLALVMTLSVGYATLASTIGFGATEGFQVELWKQIDPSVDPMTITGYYGLNEKTLFYVKYTTEDKDNNTDAYATLGARYAFKENMAAYLEYADQDTAATKIGFRGKYSVSDPLALVGDLSYTDQDTSTLIALQGQAEYAFNEKVVGTAGFVYGSPDQDGQNPDSYTNFIVGIETYPVEKVCAYLDYTVADDAYSNDDLIELGVSYSF